MRVIGLVWEYPSTHWYNNGKDFTPEELVSNLNMISPKQRSRSIPIKPRVLLPVRKALPQIDTQETDVVAIDAARLENIDEFEQQARRKVLEREAVGFRNRYYNMQPTSALATEKGLIGKRLDV